MKAYIVLAIKASWPVIEAAIRPALLILIGEQLAKAKAVQFTGSYEFLNRFLPPIEDELLKLLTEASA